MRERLRQVFEKLPPSCIVCSAACGADLIGLEMAEERAVRRLIVLPFDRATFRKKSVADRGEDWGSRFDRIMDTLPNNDLLDLDLSIKSSDAFQSTNRAILDQATSLAKGAGTIPAAVVIWDGKKRIGSEVDFTQEFVSDASSRGIHVEQVLTL